MDVRILRMSDVVEKVGLSRSKVYALIKQDLFPKPFPLVGRAVGLLESDVEDWILKKKSEQS